MPFKNPEDKRRWMEGRKKEHAKEMRDWRARNREEYNAQHKAWADQNRDRVRQLNRESYARNAEDRRAYDRMRYHTDSERRRACIDNSKARHKANPNKLRAFSLLKNYGLTLEDFDRMLVEHCGRCAVCAMAFTGAGDIHVDHSHATSEVRGLLCTNCNNGLGRFKDSPELLERAAAYLRKE